MTSHPHDPKTEVVHQGPAGGLAVASSTRPPAHGAVGPLARFWVIALLTAFSLLATLAMPLAADTGPSPIELLWAFAEGADLHLTLDVGEGMEESTQISGSPMPTPSTKR